MNGLVRRGACTTALLFGTIATSAIGTIREDSALFTLQQAAEGKALFSVRCASCHGDALQGGSALGRETASCPKPASAAGCLENGSGGVLWTCSIFPLFAQGHVRSGVLPPMSCRNGHELTPDNLAPAESGTRWRCRKCGAERAAAWRRRRWAVA
jgi:hypothetical protein